MQKSVQRLLTLMMCMMLLIGIVPASAEPTYKEEIVIGLANVFTTTDMQDTASITNQIFYTISHSTLMKWDYETQQYVPDLADS